MAVSTQMISNKIFKRHYLEPLTFFVYDRISFYIHTIISNCLKKKSSKVLRFKILRRWLTHQRQDRGYEVKPKVCTSRMSVEIPEKISSDILWRRWLYTPGTFSPNGVIYFVRFPNASRPVNFLFTDDIVDVRYVGHVCERRWNEFEN